MLSVKKYTKKYLSSCRKKIETDLAEFDQLTSITKEFENTFCRNLILVLEQMFVHRMRGLEGKDGNSLNEVRMICNSILNNGNKLLIDNTIKYNAEESILKIDLGQEISLSASDFEKLSQAFFDEIEKKFS